MSSMKAMNSRKRVSFGSKGSMVETWIIEDLPTPRTEKEEEFFAGFVPHSKSDPGLESRDNPFLPGGDLSKEAEELLKKATIVRDKFFLEQEQEKLLQEAEQLAARPDLLPHAISDAVDGPLLHPATNSNSNSAGEVGEERICPSAVSQVQAAPPPLPPQPRENGKPGDVSSALEASPDKVHLEVGDSAPAAAAAAAADGSTPAVANDSDAEQQDKDKVKRRPKCCLLM